MIELSTLAVAVIEGCCALMLLLAIESLRKIDEVSVACGNQPWSAEAERFACGGKPKVIRAALALTAVTQLLALVLIAQWHQILIVTAGIVGIPLFLLHSLKLYAVYIQASRFLWDWKTAQQREIDMDRERLIEDAGFDGCSTGISRPEECALDRIRVA